MKPLEYLDPDLFNLPCRARPDDAVLLLISFYLQHVVSVYYELSLDLSFQIRQKQVLTKIGNLCMHPMHAETLFEGYWQHRYSPH